VTVNLPRSSVFFFAIGLLILALPPLWPKHPATVYVKAGIS